MKKFVLLAALAASVALAFPISVQAAGKGGKYSRNDGTGHGACVRGGLKMTAPSTGRKFTMSDVLAYCASHGH